MVTRTAPVSDIRFAPASPNLRTRGVIGWVCCVLEGFQFDGLAIRKVAEGRYFMSFPTRRDANGTRHPYYRVLDEMTHAAMEAQVMQELRRRGYVS